MHYPQLAGPIEFAVEGRGSGVPRLCGFFGCIKNANVFGRSINMDYRAIAPPGQNRDAFESSLVIAPEGCVDHILPTISQTKVAKAIIRLIHIDVVNVLWTLASHVEPRESVGIVFPVFDAKGDVATNVGMSNRSSRHSAVARNAPSKIARGGIICDQFFKSLVSDHGTYHARSWDICLRGTA